MTADDNYDDGAYLDNVSGFGNISVTDSTFGDSGSNGNGFNGLEATPLGMSRSPMLLQMVISTMVPLGDLINDIEVRRQHYRYRQRLQ